MSIFLTYKPGVHYSNLKVGQKKFGHTQGTQGYVFTHIKGAFIKKTIYKYKSLGLAGQIKCFHEPHLSTVHLLCIPPVKLTTERLIFVIFENFKFET